MIGRDRQFDEVNRLLVADGVRGVALTGGPGVGKSELARAVGRSAAEAGWAVRRSTATATSRPIPFGAFAQWTDDLGGAPSALTRRVAEALMAGARPDRLLVLVDDAHLLDDLSALVLHLLVNSHAAKVLLTVRVGESAPAAVTALSKDDSIRRYDVDPLTRHQSDELLTTVFGSPPDGRSGDEIWRLTLGNVLFLRRLVEHESRAGRLLVDGGGLRWLGDTAISGSLAELVDVQVGVVDDAVCDVVDVVAVAEPVDWHVLRSLVRQDAIEEAEQRGLIRISGDDVTVGHPMYAKVRRNRCGSAKLRRLRGQVAISMNDAGGGAGAVKRGLLWLDSDLSPNPDVLSAAATAASSLLDFTAAERLFTAAAATGVGDAMQVPPSADANGAVMRASKLLWTKRSPEHSWKVIDEALETAHGASRQQLLVFRACQLALAARPAEVLATMTEIDVDTLDSFTAVMAFGVQSMAAGELGHPERAAATAEQAYRVLGTTDEGVYMRLPVTEFHTFALAAGGHVAEALEVAGRHVASQRAAPALTRVVASEIFGMAALAAGDLHTALVHLPDEATVVEAADRFQLANSFHRFSLLRAQALARVGDSDAADQTLEVARAHRHPTSVYVTSLETLTEAWLAASRMRLTEARRLAQVAADFARNHDQFAREVWCLQTAVQFDDADAAERLAELAVHVEGPRVATAARYAVALGSDDADGLVAASVDFEAMGDRLAAADAAGQAATAHRRAGRAASAVTAAARAHRLASACGGATSPAIVAAAFAPPFSNREREIAMLVAQGLSNRQIAQVVSRSVRTVESHVYRASIKAGVDGRTGLAAMMRNVGH